MNKNFKKRQKTGRSVDAAFISMRRMHQDLSRFIEQQQWNYIFRDNGIDNKYELLIPGHTDDR